MFTNLFFSFSFFFYLRALDVNKDISYRLSSRSDLGESVLLNFQEFSKCGKREIS